MSRLPEIAHSDRRAYPSDMSDAEWDVLRPLLPPAKGFGRPRTVNLREILNAIFYVQRSGCQWEMLPHDLPPHETVYKYFQKWHRQGIWQTIHTALRHQLSGRIKDRRLKYLLARRYGNLDPLKTPVPYLPGTVRQ